MVWVLPWPACQMQVLLSCARGVAGAVCWFAVVVATHGRLVGGCVVARIGLAGFALVLYGCAVVVLLAAICMARFVAVASSAPPDGPLVLLSGVLGRGCHWWSGLRLPNVPC